VFVSHGLSQVEQLCETVAWIEKGNLKMVGPSGDVISAYSGQSHRAMRMEGELGARWGNGDAEITSVKLLGADGQPLDVLTTHEPLTVAIDFRTLRPLQDIVVNMRIDTLNGHAVWGTSTRRCSKAIGLVDGDARAVMTMPHFPILEGTYELTLAVTDYSEMHPYDHWEKRIRFEVRQFTSTDVGLVHIPVQWEITGARGVVQGG